MKGPLRTYLSCSRDIGGEILEQSVLVEAAFKAQRDFLATSANSRKPSSDSELSNLLKPTSDRILDIQGHREARRRSELFNHLSAVSESVPALGWVSIVSLIPAVWVRIAAIEHPNITNIVLSKLEPIIFRLWVVPHGLLSRLF